MPTYPSSGTFRKRTDLSATIRPTGTSAGALVMHSNRGSEEINLISKEEDLIREYGLPDPAIGFGHYAAIPFLSQSNQLYVKRCVNGALRAGVEIIDTGTTTTATPWTTGYDTPTVTNVFPAGVTPTPLPFAVNSAFQVSSRNSGAWGNNLYITIQNLKMVNGGANQEFDLSVYENGVLDKTYTVSLDHHTDGFGQQTFIEEKINMYPGLISVRVNPAFVGILSAPIAAPQAAVTAVAAIPANPAAVPPTPAIPAVLAVLAVAGAPFSGGINGAIPTSAQIIQDWNLFRDTTASQVQIPINGGYTSIAVQQTIDAIAQARGDSEAVLDMPSDMQEVLSAQNYRASYLGINSAFSSIYSPDVLIRCPYTNATFYVPPSGFAAGVFARTDRTRAVHYAPAGLNRGMLTGMGLPVLGLRVTYDRAARDILTPSNINSILWKHGVGPYISEQETLQAMASALSNIGVSRMLSDLETFISNMMDYTLMEPGDAFLHAQIITMITEQLAVMDTQRAFQTTPDGSLPYLVSINQLPAQVDLGITPVTIMLKPNIPNKVVVLNTVITKNGASFSTLLKQGGF